MVVVLCSVHVVVATIPDCMAIFVCQSFGGWVYEQLNGSVIVRTQPQEMYATYLSAGIF